MRWLSKIRIPWHLFGVLFVVGVFKFFIVLPSRIDTAREREVAADIEKNVATFTEFVFPWVLLAAGLVPIYLLAFHTEEVVNFFKEAGRLLTKLVRVIFWGALIVAAIAGVVVLVGMLFGTGFRLAT